MTTIAKIQNAAPVKVSRKIWLAWLGANKLAFDFAQSRATRVASERDQLLLDLEKKGELVSDQTRERLDALRKRLEVAFKSAGEALPTNRKSLTPIEPKAASTDIEAKLDKLSRKVTGLSRKVNALGKAANQEIPNDLKAKTTDNTSAASSPSAPAEQKAA